MVLMESEMNIKPGEFAGLLLRSGPSVLHTINGKRELSVEDLVKCIIVIISTFEQSSQPPPQQHPPQDNNNLWGYKSDGGGLVDDDDNGGEGWKWDIKLFCEKISSNSVNELFTSRAFDVPYFQMQSVKSLEIFTRLYQLLFNKQNLSQFPLNIWCDGGWKNHGVQLQFWKCVTQASRQVIDVNSMQENQQILTMQDLSNAPPSTRAVASGWLNTNWNSLQLLQMIVRLEDREMLDLMSRQSTELTLIGLCQLPQLSSSSSSSLSVQLLDKLIAIFLVGHASSGYCLQRVYKLQRDRLMKVVCQLYKQDAQLLSRLLDVAQELKCLQILLEMKEYPFVLDLSVLASRREYLNLDKWLQEHIQIGGEEFIGHLREYYSLKKQQLVTGGTSIPLHEEADRIINKKLSSINNTNNTNTNSSSSSVEEVVNQLYERLYRLDLSVKEFIKQITPEVKQITLNNLFDEFQFLHKYPERELLITGELFGEMINSGLIGSDLIENCLKQLVTFMQSGNQKLIKFTRAAVEKFLDRLAANEWPEFMQELSQFEQLKDLFINISSNGELKEKILFLLNNLSEENLNEKSNELKQLMDNSNSNNNSQLIEWFCIYLVQKRISMEPNQHGIYLKLIQVFKSKRMERLIQHYTVENIWTIIQSTTVLQSSQERLLLKNLGYFLGRLTLQRDRPLLHKQLPVKQLLLDAVVQQRLLVQIPFTCKLLEPCSQSRVFRPPNPWLMAIVELLMELYLFADLKLNLKFEIEVLSRELKLELSQIRPSILYREFLQLSQSHHYQQPQLQQQQQLQLLHSNTIMSNNNNNNSNIVIPKVIVDQQQQLKVLNLQDFLTTTTTTTTTTNNNNNNNNNNRLPKTPLLIQLVEQALIEVLQPVVERSISIGLQTTKELIQKDFSNSNSNSSIPQQLLAQALCGGLALVTCVEPLRASLIQHLQQLHPSFELIETFIQENLQRLCLIIEQCAQEKSLLALSNSIDTSSSSGSSSTNSNYYYNLPSILKYHPDKCKIYNEFIKVSTTTSSSSSNNNNNNNNTTTTTSNELEQLLLMIKTETTNDNFNSINELEQDCKLILLIRQFNQLITMQPNLLEASLELLVKQLFTQGSTKLFLEVIILLLERVIELNKKLCRDLITWLLLTINIDGDESILLQNLTIVCLLIQQGLIDCCEFDLQLQQQLTTLQLPVVEFTLKLIQKLLDAGICTELEFNSSLQFLRLKKDLIPLELTSLLPNNNNDNIQIDENINFIHQFDTFISTNTFNNIQPLNIPDKLEQLKTFIIISIETFYKVKQAPGGAIIGYQVIDKLSLLIHNHLDLSSDLILSVLGLIIIQLHEQQRELFDQRPFCRLLLNLISHHHQLQPQHGFEKFLIHLTNLLLLIQPSKLPGFSFAWLQILSSRLIINHLINQKSLLKSLLLDCLQFMAPFLRHAEMSDAVRVLYKGILRILLLLLHDFPEFLCDNYHDFCQLIPPSCIQLRNLVLSAFPRNMRLPDPFTPNLKVDLLPEISQAPNIHLKQLSDLQLQSQCESFLTSRVPLDFSQTVAQRLQLQSVDDKFIVGSNYDLPLINSFVLFLGVYSIQHSLQHSVSMLIFQQLVLDFDSEGRYHLFNAIANQLRYPNSHTHYFSCVLLYLFAECQSEVVKEQITRVLLERLIVNRPHPWGLLITFIELLKNPRYQFWSFKFTRCALEIERLFESVARSCMIPINSNNNSNNNNNE